MSEQRLTIARMGWRGEGIADGRDGPVFVAYTLPGEVVTAEVDGERGTLRRVETASPERVVAFCKHFGSCGGCQLQHWTDDAYRTWKRGQVRQAFAKRKLDVKIADLIDGHGEGRRRISLHVRRNGPHVTAGFMAARSHTPHDIDHCPILVSALQKAPDLARAIGAVLGDCDVAITATDVGLDAVAKAERKIVAQELAKLAALAERLGLARFAVNGEVITTRVAPAVMMGKVLVQIPPGSFLQATTRGEAVLADLVMQAAGKAKSIADLFSGCGPFALRLAEKSKVQAFDSDRPAIAALQAAVRGVQGLKPVTATVRDLMREPLVGGELKDFDTVVFDPPRAGAEAQARQLAKSKVKTVIAVSCDPTTLARDAEILIGGGYKLETITAVDQFKWTSHVETVAVFRKA